MSLNAPGLGAIGPRARMTTRYDARRVLSDGRRREGALHSRDPAICGGGRGTTRDNFGVDEDGCGPINSVAGEMENVDRS